MAEIQNNFIRSKMNKDLDDRLVPSGEYRDALNIAISRSEGDDVGALETILGNELYYGESSYGTCIGLFVDQNDKKTYYFVTNYIDTSADGLSNFAPLEVYCAVIQYNHVTDYKTVLVEGQFLNFSARSPITGVNLIEDLLFWTDNRNQPRKINVTNANAFPAAPSDTQRIPSQIPTPYYTTEDQISVAKYYPWKPISLMNIGDVALGAVPTQSTMSNPTQEFYPNGTSPKPDYDENWPGDGNYLTDRFIRLSYRFKFDDNEYSLMAPFTQPCFIPKQNGYFIGDDFKETYRSTVVNFFENNVTQILANIEFETLTPNVDLKIKEVEILYKESNALQAKSIESIDIKTVMANMSANAAHGGNPRVFTYKYISTKPYKNITEDQITRVFDKVPTRALAQEIAGNRVIYGNFHTVQTPPQNIDYNISYGNKTDLLGVSQIEYPNHTLKQNRNYQVGFVLADRFGRQSSVVLSANDVAALSGGDYFGGSTIYVPYKPAGGTSALDWPGYALRALVNKPIPSRNELNTAGYPGLYKDESYGADYVVITQGGTGYTNGTYLASVTGGTGSGLTVQVSVNASRVRDVLIINNGTGYTDGDQVTVDGGNNNSVLTLAVSKPNLLGWYSYKIVVRQTEQDYYNVYLPSILNGYPASYIDGTSGLGAPNTEIGETANIVLYNDNINKVPRDLKEVGPDQKQYRSSVTLYGRVTPNNLSGLESVSSTQFYPEIIGDSVVSISTLADTNYNATTLGDITELDTSGGTGNYQAISAYSLEYVEFYQCNTNPLIARISTSKPIGRTNALATVVSPNYSWATGLGVYETDPLDSLLDIYWETTSCGLISDLNLAIFEGGFEGAVRTNGYNFILNEGDGPGTNCFPATGGPLPTPPDAYDGIQVISAQGNLMYEGVEWELLYIKDYSGAIRTQQFELYDTGAAGTQLDPLSFNIKTSSNAYFYYGSNELVRTFIAAVKVTYTNPISLEVTITTVVLDDLKLDNVRPIAVEGGDCAVPIPGSQLPTNPLNQTPCVVFAPIIDTLVTSDDFDGNIYFVNGSNCAGDDTLTELSIIQPFPSYIDTSVEPNVEYPWDTRFYLKQMGPGHVQLWLKEGSTGPYGTLKRLYVQAIDAGGRRDSSYVYVNAEVTEAINPTVVLQTNTPICIPENLNWLDGIGGTVRFRFLIQDTTPGALYDCWIRTDPNYTASSSFSIPPPPCGPSGALDGSRGYKFPFTGVVGDIEYYIDVQLNGQSAIIAIDFEIDVRNLNDPDVTQSPPINYQQVNAVASQQGFPSCPANGSGCTP
jgi:hypothetical protein